MRTLHASQQELANKRSKIEKLETTNTQLTQQMEEFDKQLSEFQASTVQLQQHVSGLTEAMGKSREALNEV